MTVTLSAARNRKKEEDMLRRTLGYCAVLLWTVLLTSVMWATRLPASRQSGAHLSVPKYITIE